MEIHTRGRLGGRVTPLLTAAFLAVNPVQAGLGAPPLDPGRTGVVPAPLPPSSLQRGVLLVASRLLADPNFGRTVVLVLDHGPKGAMGVVLNRASRLTLAEVLPEVPGIQSQNVALRVGGPVGTRRVILLLEASSPPRDAMGVVTGVYASGSQDTLRQVLDGDGPVARYHAFAGYAGWSEGQLERELARGDWHLVPADRGLLFDEDLADLWQRLIGQVQGRWVRRSPAVGPGAVVSAAARPWPAPSVQVLGDCG